MSHPMRALLVFLLLMICVVHGEYTGTTPGFVQIFHGRCFEYLERFTSLGLLDKPLPTVEQRGAYCENIWKTFHDIFAFKDACTLKPEHYDSFFKATGTGDIENKILFWSKHEYLSRAISNDGKRAIVLRDTLSGFLTTDLNWCGDPKGDPKGNGINFKACPKCKKGPNDKETKEPFEVYWGAASASFAKRAKGTVHHLVNGALPKSLVAYSKDTFFYLHELPNLSKTKVTEFRLIVANEPQKTVRETCGKETILQLQNEIKNQLGKDAVCLVNPAMVMHIMCADKPNTPECVKAITYAVGKQY